LLAALTLTSGCATRESLDLPDLGGWDSRQSLLGQLDEWAFNGRIGVVAGDDGFSGSLRWLQEGDDFEATLSGPLGIGTVRLEGNGRRVQLIDKDGNRTVLEDAERDLYLRYGWTIPVRSLRYWALGIPDPELPAETLLGDDGQLRSLAQGGWQVDKDIVQAGVGPLDAPDLQDVPHAVGGDQSRTCPFALDEGVGAYGRAVDQVVDPVKRGSDHPQHSVNPGDDPFRQVVVSGQDLGVVDLAGHVVN
jgi:outer membrane lipoprotein LolB